MSGILDSLTGPLIEGSNDVSNEDLRIINELENPPLVRLCKDDVYVRKCRLTGDGINCHYGRFHTEDLPGLLKKTQGVSCLFGHRKETAGIARFFGGSIEKHEIFNPVTGKKEMLSFIVPKIYWMKNHSMAEDLRVNIDGGIYHQTSISWYFEKPVCGICSRDIRKCDHIPGRSYNNELCFYWYEQIGEVLEGSIVYAGGHPGTGFELNDSVMVNKKKQRSIYKLRSEERLFKNDILPYLKNIYNGNIYLCGELAQNGWTDGKIKIIPDRGAMNRVGDLLPSHLADRLEISSSIEYPGNYIRITRNMITDVKLSILPGKSSLTMENSGHEPAFYETNFINDYEAFSIRIYISSNESPQKGIFYLADCRRMDEFIGIPDEYVIVHHWRKDHGMLSISYGPLDGIFIVKKISINGKSRYYITRKI